MRRLGTRWAALLAAGSMLLLPSATGAFTKTITYRYGGASGWGVFLGNVAVGSHETPAGPVRLMGEVSFKPRTTSFSMRIDDLAASPDRMVPVTIRSPWSTVLFNGCMSAGEDRVVSGVTAGQRVWVHVWSSAWPDVATSDDFADCRAGATSGTFTLSI